MELEHELSKAICSLKSCGLDDLGGRTNISLGSGCDLFMKYVTRAFKMEYMVNLWMDILCYVQLQDIYVRIFTDKEAFHSWISHLYSWTYFLANGGHYFYSDGPYSILILTSRVLPLGILVL